MSPHASPSTMNPSRPSRPSLALAALLALAPLVAQADEAPNKAAAQSLYDESQALMNAGKFPEACQKLEDSNRLFQGIGTRARLGECYEKSHRLASAWTSYRSALSAAEAKGDPRVAELRERAAALEPRLSHLRIDIPDKARTPGLKILRDGSDLPASLWGTRMPVDGGPHAIEASATGQEGWKSSVTVKDERDDVVVIVGQLASAAPATSAPVPTAPPPAASAAPPAPIAPSEPPVAAGPQRTLGLVLGGAGLVGLGLGGIFGMKTIARKNASNEDNHCNAANVCDATGTSLRNEGKTAGTLSTIFVSTGAAALAGGLLLFLTASPEPQKQGRVQLLPQLAREGGAVSLWGSW